jgi:branched-chain amino acid transport system substrate-binding protein
MKKHWLFVLLLMMTMLMVACNSDGTKDSSTGDKASEDDTKGTAEEGGTIKIGVLASLTGALESYGKQTQRGFELGIDYATGGTMEVNGKKIEVV